MHSTSRAVCLALTQLLCFGGQLETAVNAVTFHQARVKQRPDDAGALRFLAGALIQLAEAGNDAAEYDRAWENLDKADALEPANPDTTRIRARLLLSRHRFPQALALAEQGLTIVPADSELLGIAGDAAFETGDLESAAARYEKLHSASQQVTSFARLAHIAEARGNLEEAAQLLEKAMQTGSRKGAPRETIAWCHAVLGEVFLKRGDHKQARRNYELGLETSPEHALVLEHLAELEALEGNLEAAERTYRRLLTQRPDPVNRLRLAEVVSRKGDARAAEALRAESRRQLEQVVGTGNEGFLRPLAELELTAGNYQLAAALAARDVSLRPTEESKALVKKILAAAAAAGKPVNSF